FTTLSTSLSFQPSTHHRHLHSFPTRRSSDLYADYVSSRIWALRYDETKGRVVANQPVGDPNLPVMSFGEDQDGDVYFLVAAATRSEEHTSELQSLRHLVCRLLLEKKKKTKYN